MTIPEIFCNFSQKRKVRHRGMDRKLIMLQKNIEDAYSEMKIIQSGESSITVLERIGYLLETSESRPSPTTKSNQRENR